MKKSAFFAIGFLWLACYSCGNDSSIAPEPVPNPEPDTTEVVSSDTVIPESMLIRMDTVSDTIIHVLTPNKRWIRRSNEIQDGPYSEPYTVTVDEDTVIGKFVAKKILCKKQDGSVTVDRIAFEWGSRIFKLLEGTTAFYLDYDTWAISASKYFGDTNVEFLPISRGMITLQGKQRKCTKIAVYYGKDGWHAGEDYWVEGIGPLLGLTRNFVIPGNSVDPGYSQIWPYSSQLLECYDGTVKIYDYTEFSPDLYVPTEILPEASQLSPNYTSFSALKDF